MERRAATTTTFCFVAFLLYPVEETVDAGPRRLYVLAVCRGQQDECARFVGERSRDLVGSGRMGWHVRA